MNNYINQALKRFGSCRIVKCFSDYLEEASVMNKSSRKNLRLLAGYTSKLATDHREL